MSLVALTLASGLLAACSSDSDGKTEITWYINPDAGGQDAVAEKCSTDEYTIDTQVLPQSSSEQRIQLSRRLAAEDPEIDLMSLDPPFTAEFADAGFLADVPQDAKAQLEEQGTFKGAMDAATWEDKLVVFPFWSNTQVLWYRKSFVEKAGIDMSQPVTWDPIIDAAAENGGQVGVQANKYEGYSVWINALIEGAGGQLVENADKGVDLDADDRQRAGSRSGQDHREARRAPRQPGRPQSCPTRARPGPPSEVTTGRSWSTGPTSSTTTTRPHPRSPRTSATPATPRRSRARSPDRRTAASASPSASSPTHKELALEAAACLVEPENQGINAEITGNMPASTAGYDYPALAEHLPRGPPELFQDSVDAAAPRSVTPYWSDISSSLQNTWHPPADVNQDTPPESQDFIEEILEGGRLL